MRTIGRCSAALLLLVATAAIVAGGAQAAPHATAAATKCDVSKVASTLGPTAVTSLTVTKTTCKNGIAVVKAFHACRTAHGVSGRCVKRVKGYACNERRTTVPGSFSATVRCVKGKAIVAHAYTQTTA